MNVKYKMRQGMCKLRTFYTKLHIKYYTILRYRVALLAERHAMRL
jgi:hypothetical protein